MSASVTEIACTHALQPSRVPLARILVVVDPAAAVQVLEAIPCDMLVIKPPGFVSPLLVTEE